MRHLETKPMASFNETQIDTPAVFSVLLSGGAELDYNDVISATPAVTSEYDGYARPQLVLDSEQGLPRWDETRFYPVGRLATFHGRNLEVLADKVDIQDDFGNMFRSLCIKGSDFSDPHLFKSATASREYIVYGLQESLVMERVLRASKLLRENGIGTEYICGLSLPETFPIDKQGRAIDDKTPAQFGEFLETLSARYAAENQNGKSALEIKTGMIERFSDCDYLISYRAFDCPYRFGELADPEKFAEFKQFRKQNTDDPAEIERIEKQTLTGYMQREFVPNLARNLAKLRKLGLVHGFLHRDNITAIASIVDLDSVRGEALGLGDKFQGKDKLTAEIRDIFDCMEGVEMVATRAKDNEVGSNSLIEQFLSTYLIEAFDTPEQQDTFVLALLEYAYDVSHLSDDASSMQRCSQLIFGAYVDLHPDILETVRARIPLPTEKIPDNFQRRSSMYFSLFPTALIKGWREQMLKEPNPVSGSQLKGDTYQDAALNNMKLIVKNELAIHFVGEMMFAKIHGNEPLSVKQIMTALGSMLGELAPDEELDDDINERLQAMQDYFYEQNKLFLGRIVMDEHPDSFQWEPHDALSAETQSKLTDYTAEARLHVAGRAPVFYLKDEAEYAKIFQELGIDKDTEIEYANMKGVQETEYNSKDTIILADHTKTHLIACHSWKDQALQELFTPELFSAADPNIKPTIMIRNIRGGKPKVQIISYPKADKESFKETATYQELLEEVTPNTVQPRQLVLEVV